MNFASAIKNRLSSWLCRPTTDAHTVCGFRVSVENSRSDIATPDVLARLAEALTLIERVQPWRMAHLRRDLARFRIARFPCRGAFFGHDRTCLTEVTFLARQDIGAATVAASIIHEGMHARMCAMGVHHSGENLSDMERICRRAEIDFGEALPIEIGAPIVERARAALYSSDEEVAPDIDWDEALRRQQAIDDDALIRGSRPR